MSESDLVNPIDINTIGYRIVDMMDRIRAAQKFAPRTESEWAVVLDGQEYLISVSMKAKGEEENGTIQS